jgi:hypothetical protein
MTTIESLDDARDFFEKIVKPSVEDYLDTPSQFRTAFNAATALFHMHEWLYEFKKPELEMKYKTKFPKKGDFWGHVETLVQSSKYIRDLANASKHVRLTMRPSTSMTHIANTVIQSTGWGEGGYGVGRYGGRNMTMKDGADDIPLDDCVRDLMALWEPLVAELNP